LRVAALDVPSLALATPMYGRIGHPGLHRTYWSMAPMDPRTAGRCQPYVRDVRSVPPAADAEDVAIFPTQRARHAVAWAIALAVATSVLVPWLVGDAAAASCNGASHTAPSLSGGRASPGSGSPTTSISFSVRYVDQLGCAPSSVDLVISGLGTFRMRASGTTYASGVTFRFTRRLPAGRWAYRYTAASGSGAGARTSTQSAVSPSRVVIKAASTAPAPAPRSTPKPSSGGSTTKHPSTTPSKTPPKAGPSASPDAQAAAGSTPGATDDSGTGSSGTGSGATSPAPADGQDRGGIALDPSGGITDRLPVIAWTLATVLGVFVFAAGLLPVRRRRDRDKRWWGASLAAVAIGASEPASIQQRPPSGSSDDSASRTSGSSGDGQDERLLTSSSVGREPLRFHAPARPGVERRAIAYHFIRVADLPDLATSAEICRLDRGDEVEIIGEHEGFLRIRTPTGIEGWVQRMVIIG